MIPKGWKKNTIDDLCDLINGNGFKAAEWDTVGLPIIRIQNLNGSREFNYFSGDPKDRWLVNKGDLLFAWAGVKGVSFGPCLWNGPKGVLNQHIYRVVPKGEISGEFLHALLDVTTQRIESNSHGFKANFVHVQKGDIVDQTVHVPPLCEQKKIAAILSTWDRAIELTEKLIAAKQKRKQALTQQLLTGTVAKTVKLSSVVKRVNDPITPDPKSMYREIGIRSHGKGIFHKEPVTGKSLGDKRVYRIHPDCFVFNVVFAWEQAISQTTSAEEGMIASHRFPMYQPIEDKIDLDYLMYFFKTSRGKHLLGLASPGGAGRNRTLSQSGFLKTKIPLPSITEQRRISTILTTTDLELKLLDRQRGNLCLQKKGLMQQLLTGKVRVNVDSEAVKG